MQVDQRATTALLALVLVAGCGSDGASTSHPGAGGGAAVGSTGSSGSGANLTGGGAGTGAFRGGNGGGAGLAGGPGAAGTGETGCTPIKIGAIQPGVWSPLGQSASVEAWLDTPLEGPDGDLLTIQFIDRGTGFAPGTIDLSEKADTHACDHCVVVLADDDSFGGEGRAFLATEGTLTLDSVTSPVTVKSKGAIDGLVLREVVLDANDGFASTLVEGGACLELERTTWDTTVVLPTPCAVHADCGATEWKICDPETKACAWAECGVHADGGCAATGELCLFGVGTSTAGVCYAKCAPFAAETGCGEGEACIVARHDGSEGACRDVGPAAGNSPCEITHVSTGCSEGYTCTTDAGAHYCRRQCEFFGASPACDAGQACVAPGVCIEDPVDPAALGEACASPLNTPCGTEDGAHRGVCAGTLADPNALVCAKWCTWPSGECPAGQTCQPTGSFSVGYCQ